LIDVESEENKPQINADERGFVASNPAYLYRRVGFYGFGVIIFQKP
jgi:hypothetical protein